MAPAVFSALVWRHQQRFLIVLAGWKLPSVRASLKVMPIHSFRKESKIKITNPMNTNTVQCYFIETKQTRKNSFVFLNQRGCVLWTPLFKSGQAGRQCALGIWTPVFLYPLHGWKHEPHASQRHFQSWLKADTVLYQKRGSFVIIGIEVTYERQLKYLVWICKV